MRSIKANGGIGILLLAGVFIAGLAQTGAAMDREGAPDGGRFRAKGAGRQCGMMAELNLTAQQKEKLQADRVAREKKMIQLRAEEKTLKVDLRTAEKSAAPDIAKIEKLAAKIGEVHAKLIVEQAKGRAYFVGLLTPEQKKLLAEGPQGAPCGAGLCRPDRHQEAEE